MLQTLPANKTETESHDCVIRAKKSFQKSVMRVERENEIMISDAKNKLVSF
jgi:hypothetical protein